jgi:hypothetical protein
MIIMEIYLLVLFFVIVISFITGSILYIYNNVVLKRHVKNYDYSNVLNKTIRLDALDNFGFLLNSNHNKSVEINLEPVSKPIENNPPVPIPVVCEDKLEKDLEII